MTSHSPYYKCGECGKSYFDRDSAIACCAETPDSVYACGDCGNTHSDYDDALACCAKEPKSGFACGHCDQWHSSTEDAESCCTENREPVVVCPACFRAHTAYSPQGAQIEVTGHCDECNPIYTPEQKFAIDDVMARNELLLSHEGDVFDAAIYLNHKINHH